MNNTDPVVQDCMQRAAKIEFHPVMIRLQAVHELLDRWMYVRHLDNYDKAIERNCLYEIQAILAVTEKLLDEDE